VRVGVRAEFDFLDLDHLLFLARLGFPLLLFVLELAEIHDLADRGRGVRRNLDQVQAGFLRKCKALGGGDDADIFTLCPDQADLGGANLFVDAGSCVSCGRRVVRSASYGFVPSIVANFRAGKVDVPRLSFKLQIG